MHLRKSPDRLGVRHATAMLATGLLSLSAAAYAADPADDYNFDVVNQPVAVSAHSELDVKVTKVATGKPVENAKITRTHLEMTMMHRPHKSGTPTPPTRGMGGEVKVVGSPAPGTYRLLGDVSMPGTWKLDIVASVPGEAQPVEGNVTFKAGE